MDKNYLIDEYLRGKHPIDKEKWELPTDGELDRDEALYDALLAERNHSPLLWRGWGRLWGSVAAVLIAVVALFTWRSLMPQQPTQLAEKTEKPVIQEDTSKVIEKHNVPHEPTTHVKLANDTRVVDQRHTHSLRTTQPKGESPQAVKAQITPAEPLLTEAEAEPISEQETPNIPPDKQALVDIFLAEEALQVAYELRAQQETIRAYAASLTGRELPKPIIAF